MKILLDPKLALLANDLSTEDKAELLMCILEYPNRNCNLGLWKYIKDQIDNDAKKYTAKCERVAALRQKKSEMKSILKSELKSGLKQEPISPVKEVEVVDNTIKNKFNCKESVSRKTVKIVENPVENYLIDQNFNFQIICDQNDVFKTYLYLHPPKVIKRAQETLIKKRSGQLLSIKQIISWLNQENIFYAANQEGIE